MKGRIGVLLLVLVSLTSGCASRLHAFALANDTLQPQNGRVGIVMAKTPKPDTFFPGASCLLCLAAASVANTSLTTYAGTLPTSDLLTIRDEIASRLRSRQVEVVLIDEPLDASTLPRFRGSDKGTADKDFTTLRPKYDVDHLIVIDVASIGFVRNYSAYFPTSDPKGYLMGTGSIVNLRTNLYEWYLPVSITKGADGPWDEAPKFPGLTNAYFQAIETGKDLFIEPFSR